jgi:hypothetical protein
MSLMMTRWHEQIPLIQTELISKLLASVAFKMPEQNAQCHVVGCLLLLGAVVIFHGTQQLSTRKGVEQTDSLFQYWKNASRCLTFPALVESQADSLFHLYGHDATDEEEKQQHLVTPRGGSQCRTRSSMRLEHAPVSLPMTQLTPKRNILQQYNKKPLDQLCPAARKLQERFESCTGVLVERHLDEKGEEECKGTCGAVCFSRTKWYCTGCHHFYCHKIGEKRLKSKNFDSLPNGADKFFLDIGEEIVNEKVSSLLCL